MKEGGTQKITKGVEIDKDLFLKAYKNVFSVSSFSKHLEGFTSVSTSELLEAILASCILLGVSDIHIEPEEDSVKLRARIDGILQDISNFNLKIHKQLLSRIKLLSGIKLNITGKSQDGRFTIIFPVVEKGGLMSTNKKEIEIRSSSLPSEYGESLVLRVLNPEKLVEIKELGLRKDLRESFEAEIKKPNGMIIVTGPTGSGKTTTLYAVLKKIKRPEIKIITIEDPVEYHLDGISQTEVKREKGYDFASGLRAIVRQDPDVILVGEIRDLETAQIALQAALTGHLVLSTLHTNDAAGTIARIQALGEKPHNIAPAINVVIAQRLIRKICPICSKKEKVDEDTYQKIERALKNLSKEIIDYSPDIEINKAIGCDKCNNTGYKGRVGIFETLKIDPEMEKLILSSPSSSEIKEKAIQKGMITIYQDGIIKVVNGETTIEEIERVASED